MLKPTEQKPSRTAVLFAALVLAAFGIVLPNVAEARGGHGAGGGRGGGGGHFGSGAHFGGSHFSSGHGVLARGGHYGGGYYRGGHSGYGGYRPWGWAPYWSTWWWTGPNVYAYPDYYGYSAGRDDGSDAWLGDREGGDRGDEDRAQVRPEPRERVTRPSDSRGRLRFKVTPDDAAVYLDDRYLGIGEDLGASPRGIVTEPGAHTVTVTRPGYRAKTIDVTARAGSPGNVVIDLEK